MDGTARGSFAVQPNEGGSDSLGPRKRGRKSKAELAAESRKFLLSRRLEQEKERGRQSEQDKQEPGRAGSAWLGHCSSLGKLEQRGTAPPALDLSGAAKARQSLACVDVGPTPASLHLYSSCRGLSRVHGATVSRCSSTVGPGVSSQGTGAELPESLLQGAERAGAGDDPGFWLQAEGGVGERLRKSARDVLAAPESLGASHLQQRLLQKQQQLLLLRQRAEILHEEQQQQWQRQRQQQGLSRLQQARQVSLAGAATAPAPSTWVQIQHRQRQLRPTAPLNAAPTLAGMRHTAVATSERNSKQAQAGLFGNPQRASSRDDSAVDPFQVLEGDLARVTCRGMGSFREEAAEEALLEANAKPMLPESDSAPVALRAASGAPWPTGVPTASAVSGASSLAALPTASSMAPVAGLETAPQLTAAREQQVVPWWPMLTGEKPLGPPGSSYLFRPEASLGVVGSSAAARETVAAGDVCTRNAAGAGAAAAAADALGPTGVRAEAEGLRAVVMATAREEVGMDNIVGGIGGGAAAPTLKKAMEVQVPGRSTEEGPGGVAFEPRSSASGLSGTRSMQDRHVCDVELSKGTVKALAGPARASTLGKGPVQSTHTRQPRAFGKEAVLGAEVPVPACRRVSPIEAQLQELLDEQLAEKEQGEHAGAVRHQKQQHFQAAGARLAKEPQGQEPPLQKARKRLRTGEGVSPLASAEDSRVLARSRGHHGRARGKGEGSLSVLYPGRLEARDLNVALGSGSGVARSPVSRIGSQGESDEDGEEESELGLRGGGHASRETLEEAGRGSDEGEDEPAEPRVRRRRLPVAGLRHEHEQELLKAAAAALDSVGARHADAEPSWVSEPAQDARPVLSGHECGRAGAVGSAGANEVGLSLGPGPGAGAKGRGSYPVGQDAAHPSSRSIPALSWMVQQLVHKPVVPEGQEQGAEAAGETSPRDGGVAAAAATAAAAAAAAALAATAVRLEQQQKQHLLLFQLQQQQLLRQMTNSAPLFLDSCRTSFAGAGGHSLPLHSKMASLPTHFAAAHPLMPGNMSCLPLQNMPSLGSPVTAASLQAAAAAAAGMGPVPPPGFLGFLPAPAAAAAAAAAAAIAAAGGAGLPPAAFPSSLQVPETSPQLPGVLQHTAMLGPESLMPGFYPSAVGRAGALEGFKEHSPWTLLGEREAAPGLPKECRGLGQDQSDGQHLPWPALGFDRRPWACSSLEGGSQPHLARLDEARHVPSRELSSKWGPGGDGQRSVRQSIEQGRAPLGVHVGRSRSVQCEESPREGLQGHSEGSGSNSASNESGSSDTRSLEGPQTDYAGRLAHPLQKQCRKGSVPLRMECNLDLDLHL